LLEVLLSNYGSHTDITVTTLYTYTLLVFKLLVYFTLIIDFLVSID